VETILPYVNAPENLVPGQPLFYASALPLDGYARGVLVETDMGRPTKVEGNPGHPASLGGTDIYAQAAVLDLWDPDRSRTVLSGGQPATWEALLRSLDDHRERLQTSKGRGLAVLTGTLTSPSLAAAMNRLLERYPQAGWYHPRPAGEAEALAASQAAFGEPLVPRLHLERAGVMLCLDADPLGPGPEQVAHARAFARARDPEAQRFLRLYAAEPTPGLTGAMADHRLALRHREVETLARRLAFRLGLDLPEPDPGNLPDRWVEALIRDLREQGQHALVIAGPRQPEAVHRLACAINAQLGAIGTTVDYAPCAAATATPHAGGLAELAEALRGDEVDLLLMLEVNPVYEAPADLGLAEALPHAGAAVHLGLYPDETAAISDWHVPAAHPLESWTDLRAADGTASIVQPAIAPLHDGRTGAELLEALQDGAPRTAHEIVREHWRTALGTDDFDTVWQRALRVGVVGGTAIAAREVKLAPDWQRGMADPARGSAPSGLDLVFRPDATVHDGRFANNAWLQELPKPFTRITWDNAVLMAPATARRLGLDDGDVVRVRLGERTIEGPVWRLPGQAPETLTLPLGYGRRRAGRIGTGRGFDVNALRTAAAPWAATGAELSATGRREALATTQNHHRMEGRAPLRTATLTDYRGRTGPLAEAPPLPSLYPARDSDGHAWGMSIDLGSCIGCGACTLACQAENNIPVVGKEEVARGREMHWIRVDRYFAGPPDAPRILFQPVPCMHCEDAPCEVVCPVGATLHDSEGLNLQVYNRCVGTRFCSNNCPYKVRRFNFLDYTGGRGQSIEAQRNPQVTVRQRGVMEKCTYCLQRINAARIHAQTTGAELKDGDVVTACQAACPTRAIVFGDLNLADSRVARAKSSPRTYALLRELGTRPRTTYQIRLSNPGRGVDEEDT
jgi:molybdopterin-containing oxidoreductase family iron-sulfur binding subunit